MQISERVVDYMVQILVKQLRYFAQESLQDEIDECDEGYLEELVDHIDNMPWRVEQANRLSALADAIEQGVATDEQYMDAIEICSVM